MVCGRAQVAGVCDVLGSNVGSERSKVIVASIGSGGSGGGVSRQHSVCGGDGVSGLGSGGCWTLASVPGTWHGFVILVWLLLLEGRRCVMNEKGQLRYVIQVKCKSDVTRFFNY